MHFPRRARAITAVESVACKCCLDMPSSKSYSHPSGGMTMPMKRKKKQDRVTVSLERLYKIVEKRLTSLPEGEAMRRIKAIDAAHSQVPEPDSKIPALPLDTQGRPALSRSRR